MIANLSVDRLVFMLWGMFNQTPGRYAGFQNDAAGHPSAGSQPDEDNIVRLQAMLRERDLIIDRQERVMRDRTRQLDVMYEELASVVRQLDDVQAALEGQAQQLLQLDQTAAKYRTWLTGYDANLIYLQDQIAQRDQWIRELTIKMEQVNGFVRQLADSGPAGRAE